MEIVSGNIQLSENDHYENFVTINNEEFYLEYLIPGQQWNKGASSNLFTLKDPSEETEDRVIKICKTEYFKYSKKRPILRFKREIKAFEIIKKKKIKGVIKYFESGVVEILNKDFLFIILEKANSDLASFLTKNKFNFTNNQRLAFCVNILNNFQELHNAGIYHRDIKHDNILCVDDEFKIGDLGLVDFQTEDFVFDYINEKIGPVGWLSPEATNKMLSDNQCNHKYDCVIDSSSDIFQLGKLFWYIFQGNLPIGQLEMGDSNFNDGDIFNIIFSMLQYDKQRRPTINNINTSLIPIRQRLIV